MKTFEQLFRASTNSPAHVVNDMFVKAADGTYWNARIRDMAEWFATGQAQNLAMLGGMYSIAKWAVETHPALLEVEGLAELMADVEEVLKNEKA